MANLGNILNLVNCGLGAVLGTGTKGCAPFFKKVTALSFLPAGFKLDSTRTLDFEYFKELQSTGKLIHVKGIRAFTDNSADDTIDELEDGTKQVARYGLYEFMVNFIGGMYFQAALTSLNSFGDYDVIFWDREGSALGTKSADGSLKGLTVGMIQASRLSWATDAQGLRNGLAFQLLERSEIDTNYVYISSDNLDFNPNMVDGINETVVSFASVPVDASTSITLKVITKQDSKPLTGALFSDFIVKRDGVTANPTAGDDSVTPGTYVLTTTINSTNEKLAAGLYDNAENREVIAFGDDLYKSNTATTTVV
jgi:hypothetical protein